MLMSARVRRIGAFEERFARAQASRVVEFDWGYVLLQAEYPASWQHNRVVVTSAVDPAEVVAAADEVLGGAGHTHRLVQFNDDVAGESAATTFEAAGYQVHERIVTMIHSGALPARTGNRVKAIEFDQLRPALLHDWRADYPDDTDEQITQLADRVLLYARGAEVAFLAVQSPTGEVIARGELYVADGIAQFENLITRPESRGEGHGRQLVTEALHRAREAGADLSFLIAEATDWPRSWYRRLGYQDANQTHVYQRVP
ncbi:GNAT family N-acetyltransferase [Actinokineospora sp. NBRC 105648]|uniref:GNAT family N-acetyltransferase n=1 Tax=Actinokineospora sp. NBRC 105648 TaxID=3032206 RepID=UPI0025527E59|nr:GNAT family N-acetyltransferase [Actinokineospora sp. NBRC 105648]